MISECQDVCRAFRQRQNTYGEPLASIHAMFIRVIRAEKVLRSKHGAKLSKLIKLKLRRQDISMLRLGPIAMPLYPDDAGVCISSSWDIQGFVSEHDQQGHNFLCNCKFFRSHSDGIARRLCDERRISAVR